MTTEIPVSSTAKLGSGDTVYCRNVYADGRVEFTTFDINDPGQNESPSTAQAYRACRGEIQVRF